MPQQLVKLGFMSRAWRVSASLRTRRFVAALVPSVAIGLCGGCAKVDRLSQEQSETNLIQNGSFESGANIPNNPGYLTLSPGSTAINNWTVIKGGIDYYGTGWVASDGRRSLDLNGTPGVGGVSQQFATTPGQTYHVRFDMAGHYSGLLQTMGVRAAKQSQNFTFQSGTDPQHLGWKPLDWDFTAKETHTTLEFYSLQTGYPFGGPAIDNVRVAMVDQGPRIHFTDTPQGKAPNLIVLVHGCCTDEADVAGVWNTFRDDIHNAIIQTRTPGAWEIVVWNWSEQTPKPTISDALQWFAKADKAYFNAVDDQSGKPGQGSLLAEAISAHHYDYVQLIGESSGAKLIDVAAKKLAKTRLKKQRLFIHLTFLDAYTRTAEDSGEHGYGYLEGYLKDKQYADHYVDKSVFTDAADACLLSAFNYNISNWRHDEREGGFPPGHQWPRNWYEKSITSTSPPFKYGYTLSLAGSGNDINELVSKQAAYPVGKRCDLTYIPFFNESQHCQPTACWK